jgi:FMN-dependent NADH-azoreductase
MALKNFLVPSRHIFPAPYVILASNHGLFAQGGSVKLLHLDASIRNTHSVSRAVTAAIVDKLKRANPGIEVAYRDLIATPPPHMTFATLPDDHPSSAFAGPLTPPERLVRKESQKILEEFVAADIVVIGAPMYNWSLPTQLKSWLDIIVVPGRTFTYDQFGPERGLAGDKRVIVVLTRGQFYSPGARDAYAEHAATYLRAVLSFLGMANPEFIVIEGVTAGEDNKARAIASARDALEKLAA